MKVSKLRLLPIALLAIGLVIGYALPGYAAHSGVTLRDASTNPIQGGTSVPYSPKITCGTTGCHDQYILSRNLTISNVYESDPAVATKTQAGAAYDVPYPQHGVTAGYHFQQGRNVAWGSTQKSYYGLPGFTSSPGMYGKY